MNFKPVFTCLYITTDADKSSKASKTLACSVNNATSRGPFSRAALHTAKALNG